MLKLFCAGLAVLCLTAVDVAAQSAPAAAGRVKVVSGAATITRGTNSAPAAVGQEIFEGDVLKTGPDGRLGVTLKDDTRLSLSPSSALRIDDFAFSPEAKQLSLGVKFLTGIAAYVSGRIAKLSPDAVRLETPAAIVGVRGTTLVIQVVP
jgi:hypothetical protein